MDHRSVDLVARSQHGLVTTEQLTSLGVSRRSITRWVASRRLDRVRRGVYRLPGAALSQEQAWLAAILCAEVDAVLSHASGAFAWRLRSFGLPDTIDLLSVRRRVRLPGVRAHETTWLPGRDRTMLRGLPVTTAERTLIDAGNLVAPRDLGRTIDDALRRKVISLPRLVRAFDDVPLSGRRPSRAMRVVLAERVPGYDPGGSDAELDVLKILRAAGIRPLPVQQYRIRIGGKTYRPDYAWPETKHLIEFDSPTFHGDVSAFHDDRTRLRRLQGAGWTPWLVTKHTTANEVIAIGVAATGAGEVAS